MRYLHCYILIAATLLVSTLPSTGPMALSSRAAFAQPLPPPSASSPSGAGTIVSLPAVVTAKGDGSVTISGGSILGQIIMVASLILAVPVAAFATKWLQAGAKRAGIEVSDAARGRLQEIVEHGLALAAQRAQVDIKDKLDINVKAGVATDALVYVQDHAADTFKQLGIDPTDPKAIEAIQARVAKAMEDKLPPPAVAVVAAPAA